MITLKEPSIEAVRKVKPSAMEHVTIFDSISEAQEVSRASISRGFRASSTGSWTNGLTSSQATERLGEGDLQAAAQSDVLLDSLEKFLHVETRRFRIIDAVAGGAPNIPAYLAGQPLAMRRRQRIADEQAPLTVVIDTTISASMNAHQIMQRGTSCLALVRALATRRPVKLYAHVGLGGYSGKDAHRIFMPIETAPIDLARAAFILTHASFPRAFGYPTIEGLADRHGISGWPYNDAALARRTERQTFENWFGGEVFNISGSHIHDDHLNNPAKWLEETLTKFGMAA